MVSLFIKEGTAKGGKLRKNLVRKADRIISRLKVEEFQKTLEKVSDEELENVYKFV